MLSFKKHLEVFVCIEPVDFRKGIDGLAALVEEQLGMNPRAGSLFLFCNSRRSSLKILVYDKDGYWLALKRFSKGKIPFWPRREQIDHRSLRYLLSQGM